MNSRESINYKKKKTNNSSIANEKLKIREYMCRDSKRKQFSSIINLKNIRQIFLE